MRGILGNVVDGIKSAAIITASVVAGLVGAEICAGGAEALVDDIQVVTGQKVYTRKKHWWSRKEQYTVNFFTGKENRVKVDKNGNVRVLSKKK
jgi:hypothetical protein